MTTKRIRVERLMILPNIPAGMNVLVIMSLVYAMRSSHFDPPPIVVQRQGKAYRILDGRHRFFAAVIAGRHNVLCVIENPERNNNE